MNRYEFICQYCNHSWQSNYMSKETLYCIKCNDSHIRVKDLKSSEVDYYAGSPEFEDDPNWNL